MLLEAIEEPLRLPGRDIPRFIGLSGLAGTAALAMNAASRRKKRAAQKPSPSYRRRIAELADDMATASDQLTSPDRDPERHALIKAWPAQLRSGEIAPIDIYPDLAKMLGELRRSQLDRELEINRNR